MPETKLARYFKHTPLSMVIVIGVAFLSACAPAPGGTLVPRPADGFAFGTLTIVGGPVYCIKVWDPQINGFQTICNNTSINVEIDGTWAGTWALRSDTGSSMALKLANAINNHSVLKTKVVAAASGNEVLVRARTAGVDFTYPWYTTCSFNTEYFTQCAFEAKRSPNAILGM